jgi:outer membrane protein assembly factor BamA
MDGAPGHSLSLRGRLASEALGAEADYGRWTLAARATQALPAGHRLALGLRGGWVGERAPYYERFRLGGSYSLRGFRDHSLSPPEGHDAVFTAALEYRVPLLAARGGHGHGRSGERLGALAFADAGRGWLERTGSLAEPDIDYDEWQLGAGYGLRLTLPWLGTLGLDVGFPVTAGITGEPVWVYLTLGHTF